MHRWVHRSLFTLLIATGIIVAGSASAITTWQFDGNIRTEGNSTTFSPALVALGIDVGAPISGYFAYDETVPDDVPALDRGVYDSAVLWGEFTVGSVTISVPAAGVINTVIVDTDVYHSPTDQTFGIISMTGGGFSPDLDIGFTFLELVASDLSVIASDDIPVVPPDLADLTTFDELFPFPWLTSFGFSSSAAGGSGLVRAEITSLTAVPEPSTALLVALGLLGLGARRAS